MIRVGANPIIWSNDDFRDLGADITLDECLSQMREAGYEGTELGHKYPRNAKELKPILKKHDLSLVTGWYSSYILRDEEKVETQRFDETLAFMKEMGASCMIIAECTKRTYHEAGNKMSFGQGASVISESEWDRLAATLDRFSDRARSEGVVLVLHPHMGTIIQDDEQVDALMSRTQKLSLAADTGHLAYAGSDPLGFFKKYISRIDHVHLKDVRTEVVTEAVKEQLSFDVAVKKGVFTVPGDGSVDFRSIFDLLKTHQYDGWLVVEAEQDPEKANPFEYARMGRDYIKKHMGV